MIVRHVWFQWFKEHPFVITSISDGIHGKGSKHYIGNAFDLRVRDPHGEWSIPLMQQRHFADVLKKQLGSEFDIVLHEGGSAHLHVEYDPEE